jgi:hypothetical protein
LEHQHGKAESDGKESKTTKSAEPADLVVDV